MDSVTNSQAPAATQMYAMKKSLDVQEQSVSKILDSAAAQTKNIQDSQVRDQQMQHSTAQKTGLGQSLDLKA